LLAKKQKHGAWPAKASLSLDLARPRPGLPDQFLKPAGWPNLGHASRPQASGCSENQSWMFRKVLGAVYAITQVPVVHPQWP